MPQKQEHLRKADDNEKLALRLDLSISSAPNWAIVMTFYSALHYVEAYFADSSKHYRLHRVRDSMIQRDPKIRRIFRSYRRLSDCSEQARYEAYFFDEGQFANIRKNLDDIKAVVVPLL
ncbi:MAG: hypothetical protein ACRD4V_04500 [Candidatus Acidiferrales bacterium]